MTGVYSQAWIRVDKNAPDYKGAEASTFLKMAYRFFIWCTLRNHPANGRLSVRNEKGYFTMCWTNISEEWHVWWLNSAFNMNICHILTQFSNLCVHIMLTGLGKDCVHARLYWHLWSTCTRRSCFLKYLHIWNCIVGWHMLKTSRLNLGICKKSAWALKQHGQMLPKLIENIQENMMWQFQLGRETSWVFGEAGKNQMNVCVFPTAISIVPCLSDPLMFIVFWGCGIYA